MRFKLDENLPVEVAELLREAGHDAATIHTETYRTFYVARFAGAVYVFYIVHKKATKGIGLPKYQSDLAAARYKEIVEWRQSEGLP